MRLLPVALLAVLLLVPAVSDAPAAAGQPPYAAGEVLVKFRPHVSRDRAETVMALLDAEPLREYAVLAAGTGRCHFLARSSRLSTEELLARFAADPDVESVSPNWRRRLQRTPNDDRWWRLWNMRRISAETAWDSSVGDAGVVVAVLDTGVDYTHPDLAGNMWRNPGETPGNGIDDDNNGFVDDYYGYDFAHTVLGGDDGDPRDADGHGTHVAGTIAAVGDNALGVAGVCWAARIMALKVARPISGNNIYDSDVIQALSYAVQMKTQRGVNIVAINASFGGTGYNGSEQDAIALANQAGIVFVAAAGNGGDDSAGDDNDASPQYPSGYDVANVVAVAATDANDQLATFSNYGAQSVDLAAPGVSIFSTLPRGSGQEALILNMTAGGERIEANAMTFSALTPAPGLTRNLVSCGKGLSAADFPAAVNGRIALIERGDNTFASKATLAMAAGADGVVIFNNADGNFLGTLGAAGSWVPVVSVSRADGLALRALGMPAVNLINTQSDYGYLDGTSMATPHVTGAVALLAAYYPGETPLQRIGRIYAGVDRVPALDGKVRSGGRLNLDGALNQALRVGVQVARGHTNAWLIRKDYADVALSVEKLRPLSGESYRIYRRRGGDAYQLVFTVVGSALQNNAFGWADRDLDSGVAYTYQVQAVDGGGVVLALSDEVTI